MSSRITREFYFMESARLAASRGTCLRAQVGAVLSKNNRIVSTGYNGAPAGRPQCDEVGCDQDLPDLTCKRAIHAEANCLLYAARAGIQTEFTDMWCTHSPCPTCAQLIVAAGIIQVHYHIEYREERGIQLLKEMDILVVPHSE